MRAGVAKPSNVFATAGALLKDFSAKTLDKAADSLLTAVESEAKSVHTEPEWKAFRDRWMARTNGILTQINDGQGTMGALLKDRKLYDHADTVMTSTSDLITAIRKDPKKYLTFHVKIF